MSPNSAVSPNTSEQTSESCIKADDQAANADTSGGLIHTSSHCELNEPLGSASSSVSIANAEILASNLTEVSSCSHIRLINNPNNITGDTLSIHVALSNSSSMSPAHSTTSLSNPIKTTTSTAPTVIHNTAVASHGNDFRDEQSNSQYQQQHENDYHINYSYDKKSHQNRSEKKLELNEKS